MHTDELIRQLRAPDQRGMGRIETAEYGPDNLDRLSSLDATAKTVRVWDASTIPGNLQTLAYSASVVMAAYPFMSETEVSRRVMLKEQRARTFLRRTLNSLQMAWFVIGERAITHCLHDASEVHALQLGHLIALSEHDKLSIRVLADDVVTPGLAGQFALYGLDDTARVGYVETIMGSWYSTRMDDMAKLHATFSDISAAAMSTESTRTFIREALMSWRSAKKESTELMEELRSSSPRTAPWATTALESPEHTRPSWRSEP